MVHLGSLVIRQARQQDFDKIDKMFRANAPYDPDRYLYKILEVIEPESITIATNGGQPVGCAYGHFHGDGIGIIGGLFVKKGYTGGDKIDALLKACMARLRLKNCSDLISMRSEDDQFSQYYANLGFNIWRRKSWSFVETQKISSNPNNMLEIQSVSASELWKYLDLSELQSDLIPSRFWYRRFSQESTVRMNSFVHLGSGESPSLVLWSDISALRVSHGKYPQYFLFDERCASLKEIGESTTLREISLSIGPKRIELIKRVAKDARNEGIDILLIHQDSENPLDLSDGGIPTRFSTPRTVLRSSIGSSLDAFLGKHPQINENMPIQTYATISQTG